MSQIWRTRSMVFYSRLSLAQAIVHIVNALKYLYLAFFSFWMNDVHTTCSSSTCHSISQLWFKRSALWMGCWELYDTLLLWNWIEITCCFSSASRWIKWNVKNGMYFSFSLKLAAVFNLCYRSLSMCFTFPHHPNCTLQSHHPLLSNPQPTKAQYRDYQPPIYTCITPIN